MYGGVGMVAHVQKNPHEGGSVIPTEYRSETQFRVDIACGVAKVIVAGEVGRQLHLHGQGEEDSESEDTHGLGAV